MIPTAEVRHRLARRTRLGVAECRGRTQYFAQVKLALMTHSGVTGVSTNAVTGSVLIDHSADFDAIAAFGQSQGLFRIGQPAAAAHTPAGRAQQGFAAMDRVLTRMTAGDLDARSALLLTLVALAAVQAARGHILGPASTLLWAALSLVRSEGK